MTRRELREQIFRVLFQYNFFEEETLPEQAQIFFEGLKMNAFEDSFETEDDDIEQIRAKIIGIKEHVAEIDESINEKSTGWKVSRMNKVDLTILRLAVYEMKYDEAIPEAVAINEAVELAKKYGSDDSPSFVNGVLAKLV